MSVATNGIPKSRQIATVPGPRLRRARRDHEFLAPDLEILETPPSPIGAAMILTICAFALTAIAWAYFGNVDIVATAEGKIEPQGKVKVIQPVIAGRIASILVHDGDHVTAGQVVAQLETRDAEAQLDDAREQFAATKAEIVRRQTAIAALEPLSSSRTDDVVAAAITWPADVPQADRDREQGVLAKDVDDLRSQLVSIDQQIAQKSINVTSVASTVSAQQDLDDTLNSLAEMRQTLVGQQSGSKADWLSALEQLKAQEVILSADLKEEADDKAAIDVLKSQAAKTWAEFLSDYTQKLSAAQEHADELSHKVDLAAAGLDDLTLRSPIDGIVEASSLTTLGQVVGEGAELMRIVPSTGEIDVTAYLPNSDVGFVRVGQDVQIKVAAFPYTQYGVIPGTIVGLGGDALPLSDATGSLGDPAHTAADAGNAGDTQQLVFPVRVQLAQSSISVNGTSVPLEPGMSVSVDINTGSRRILDYLLSPIEDVGSAAMHER